MMLSRRGLIRGSSAAGLALAAPSIVRATAREKVEEPRTWFVHNTQGSDQNDGSVDYPFRSPNACIRHVVRNFDFAAEGTIRLMTTGTTYAENIVLRRYVESLGWEGYNEGRKYLRLQGDPANNAAVMVYPPALDAVVSVNGSAWIVESLTVCSVNGAGLNADAQGQILSKNMNFGNCGAAHITAQHLAFFEHIGGGFTISGSTPVHARATMAGQIKSEGGNHCTVINTPTLNYRALADGNGVIDYTGVTWAGFHNLVVTSSATGSGGQVFGI